MLIFIIIITVILFFILIRIYDLHKTNEIRHRTLKKIHDILVKMDSRIVKLEEMNQRKDR